MVYLLQNREDYRAKYKYMLALVGRAHSVPVDKEPSIRIFCYCFYYLLCYHRGTKNDVNVLFHHLYNKCVAVVVDFGEHSSLICRAAFTNVRQYIIYLSDRCSRLA